jgi:hypothetical protein
MAIAFVNMTLIRPFVDSSNPKPGMVNMAQPCGGHLASPVGTLL